MKPHGRNPLLGAMRSAAVVVAVITTIASVGVQAQETDPNEVTDFCSSSGGSIAVLDNKAYIYGGYTSFNNFPNHTGPNNQLRIIPLSKPFRTGQDVAAYMTRQPIPATIPRNTYAAWWPVSARNLVAFFGYRDRSPVDVQRQNAIATTVDGLDAKLVYDVQDGLWAMETVRRADLEMRRIGADKDGALQKPASRMAAWVPSLKRGYMIGGTSYRDSKYLSDAAARLFDDHKGFLVYDLAADSWTNRTMPVPRTRSGVLAHISTRDDEVLVMFGGNTDPVIGSTGITRSMREFNIYSTAKDKWYSFLGSEEARRVPDPRNGMCHTAVAAPDGSSAQIVIYGGADGPGADLLTTDSVWALTLPSFDWVQLSGNASDPSRLPGRRYDPVCAGIGRGGRYMLSWGGRHDVGEGNRSVCDIDGNAAFLLDVSRGMWVDTFDPAPEYQVPQEVVDVIGGSPSGGATKLRPDGGWGGNDELASIMRPKLLSLKDSTPSPKDSTPSPPKSSNRTWVIAGGVLGSLAALAALAYLLFILRRRRSRVNGGSPDNPMAEMDTGMTGALLDRVHEAPGSTGGGGTGGVVIEDSPTAEMDTGMAGAPLDHVHEAPAGAVIGELMGDSTRRRE